MLPLALAQKLLLQWTGQEVALGHPQVGITLFVTNASSAMQKLLVGSRQACSCASFPCWYVPTVHAAG